MGLFDKLTRPPSKDKYAHLLRDAILKAGETRPIQYDDVEFRLCVEDHSLYLGNLYGEYCAFKPGDRTNSLGRTVHSWFESANALPDSWDEARTDLLPVVRTRSYIEAFRIEAQIEGGEDLVWPHQVVGEHLAIGLAYDLPHSIATVTQDKLDDWGVTFYEALEIALDNLRHMECQAVGCDSPRFYVVSSDDYYDASRLIHLDFVRQLEVRGAYVAMVPNRSKLLVTGSDEEAGLAAMAEIAKSTLQEPRALSGLAFRLVGDDWQPWLPPERHPSWKAFKDLQIESMHREYAEQKERNRSRGGEQ